MNTATEATATEAKATWRKTKANEWVVMAPASALIAGTDITVTAKSGAAKAVSIVRVGRPFAVAGVEMAYGYVGDATETESRPAPTYQQRARAATARRRSSKCVSGGDCSSFGNGRSCGADDCDGW